MKTLELLVKEMEYQNGWTEKQVESVLQSFAIYSPVEIKKMAKNLIYLYARLVASHEIELPENGSQEEHNTMLYFFNELSEMNEVTEYYKQTTLRHHEVVCS